MARAGRMVSPGVPNASPGLRPVRYMLREATLKGLLQDCPPGHFFELGHGAGFTLEMLARLGFTGKAYDQSPEARDEAAKLVEEAGIGGAVTLLDAMPESERFDYVFLLEVVGYFEDPLADLRRLRKLLKDSGRIFLSFNGLNATYNREFDGNIKRWSRAQMRDLVEQAGFDSLVMHNYGFPLTNAMRPVLNAYHSLRPVHNEVGATGLYHRAPLVTAVSRVFSGSALAPFVTAQRWFRDSERGNGYVLSARAR